MKRLRHGFASASVLLCCAGTALAQPTPETAAPLPAGDELCETGTVETIVLTQAEKARCQQLWRERIDAARQRNKAHIEQTIEDNRQRRANVATLPTPPVTVESFIAEGQLQYGDVVVTDRGPRVFIGRPENPVGSESFVPVDSPLSPHRARATQFDGAFPGRKVMPPTDASQNKTGRRASQP